MTTILILAGFLATFGVAALVIAIVLQRGCKNASKTFHTVITYNDYITGKSEIRLATLHEELTEEGYQLDGFDVYPRISKPLTK